MSERVKLGSLWKWPSSSHGIGITPVFFVDIVYVADNGVVVRYDDNSTEIISNKELLDEWEQV